MSLLKINPIGVNMTARQLDKFLDIEPEQNLTEKLSYVIIKMSYTDDEIQNISEGNNFPMNIVDGGGLEEELIYPEIELSCHRSINGVIKSYEEILGGLKKCQCGAHAVGSIMHSSWCVLSEKI